MSASDRYRPIGAYAVVGDCRTAALISDDGSVDWYCPGRFDAPAVLCRLLDADKGGYLRVAPAGDYSTDRRYRGPTNILETTFVQGDRRVRVTDALTVPNGDAGQTGSTARSGRGLLRLIECISGDVELELRFRPTIDYARAATELRPVPGLGAVARAEDRYLTLACPGVSLEWDGAGGLRGRLNLQPGDRRWVALVDGGDPDQARAALAPVDWTELLDQTRDYWERWAESCTYQGPYRRQVLRSALVLKLLTYGPTGALVAAPTTSLPEEIGGVRNWDYRYAWLRDSALVLYALMTVGFGTEAADFFLWLDRAMADRAARPLQILYTIDGKPAPPEQTLDHLDGYRHSRPVRIGNAAAEQQQLDVFGEVLTAAYLHYRRGGSRRGQGEHAAPDAPQRPSDETWAVLRGFVEQAATRWREPDRSIWEVRGGPEPFLYSKLMCWAALDRGLLLAREHGLEAPLDRWSRARDRVRKAILRRGYDRRRGAFTQAFGSSSLDASALAIPRVGFLPATDPRVRSTVDRIQTELTRDGLVQRYRTEDGLPGGEGTFSLCTFWLVDALALAGRLDEAHDLFERVVGYANDVGLLAEEIEPASGTLLGNFPQGFSHAALIGAAVNLAKVAKHGPEGRRETEGERAGRAHRAAAEGHSRRAYGEADEQG